MVCGRLKQVLTTLSIADREVQVAVVGWLMLWVGGPLIRHLVLPWGPMKADASTRMRDLGCQDCRSLQLMLGVLSARDLDFDQAVSRRA